MSLSYVSPVQFSFLFDLLDVFSLDFILFELVIQLSAIQLYRTILTLNFKLLVEL